MKKKTKNKPKRKRVTTSAEKRYRHDYCMCKTCEDIRNINLMSMVEMMATGYGLLEYAFIRKTDEKEVISAIVGQFPCLHKQTRTGTMLVMPTDVVSKMEDGALTFKPMPTTPQEKLVLITSWEGSPLWGMSAGLVYRISEKMTGAMDEE